VTPVGTPHAVASRHQASNAQTPGQYTRDISWLLVSLQISSDSNTKLEALKELKQLAKQGRDQADFWRNNCGQVSVLDWTTIAVPIVRCVIMRLWHRVCMCRF
jgi:hypothetical protein